MSHDPRRAAAFFDEYGDREWTRFEDDRTPSTSLDVTVCYGGPISYTVDRAEDAVAELARVTRPGGHVLVSVMSLVGAVQAYADAVLTVATRYDLELTERIVTTG